MWNERHRRNHSGNALAAHFDLQRGADGAMGQADPAHGDRRADGGGEAARRDRAHFDRTGVDFSAFARRQAAFDAQPDAARAAFYVRDERFMHDVPDGAARDAFAPRDRAAFDALAPKTGRPQGEIRNLVLDALVRAALEERAVPISEKP